jgi:hypothetical protein
MKGVYFFLKPYRIPEDTGYQHQSVALAEGLGKLGVPVYSNIDYWKNVDGSFLFHATPDVRPEDCDVVVAEHAYFDEEGELPSPFRAPGRSYRTVYLDGSDGWRTAAMGRYGDADLVLKCHYNRRFAYGSNVRPWAFGLSQRIIDALAGPGARDWGGREPVILSNFRVNHPVRTRANRDFLPLLGDLFHIDSSVDSAVPEGASDRLLWEQSGRRHYPAFYSRLGGSAACAAFGGYFVPSFSRSLDSLALRVAYKLMSKARLSTGTVAQFDSWRFWESLAAGCLTFHADLDRYGCEFPVPPENGVTYLGIDLSRTRSEADRVRSLAPSFGAIAAEGRRWALEHYSPTAVAQRFLELAL